VDILGIENIELDDAPGDLGRYCDYINTDRPIPRLRGQHIGPPHRPSRNKCCRGHEQSESGAKG
jgi:hypothetical protein